MILIHNVIPVELYCVRCGANSIRCDEEVQMIMIKHNTHTLSSANNILHM